MLSSHLLSTSSVHIVHAWVETLWARMLDGIVCVLCLGFQISQNAASPKNLVHILPGFIMLVVQYIYVRYLIVNIHHFRFLMLRATPVVTKIWFLIIEFLGFLGARLNAHSTNKLHMFSKSLSCMSAGITHRPPVPPRITYG